MLCTGAVLLAMVPQNVRIGNFLVTSPNGISIVWSPKSAAVIDFGGDYVAGVAAPDESYHRQDLTIDGKPVTLEWGRVRDMAVGRLTSEQAIQVKVQLKQSWPDVRTEYTLNPLGCVAVSGGNRAIFACQPPPTTSDAQGVTVSVDRLHPTHFTFGGVQEVTNSKIDAALDRARDAYAATMPTSTGDWGDFLSAIPSNLNNSRIYASDEDRIAHSVSRGWAGGNPNNAPYFCWDSFFNGALASLDDPKTARETVRAILSWQTPEGLVPNFGHWQFDNGRASNDRSQPPVGSLCIWKMHQRWPDTDFLREVYPRLLAWHRWWPKFRDGDHNGLLEWGSDKAGKQGALWETGWDDTPQYADSEMVGSTLDTDAVDLNALWSMDAENLAHIADAVGDHVNAKALRKEHDETNKRINERLWNPALGMYCSRKWDSKGGQFLTRLTPMNFYPLICGAPSRAQAKCVISVMTDPKKFWGRWILPTVSYDDPAWPDQGYWHGTVWAPVNFLVFQGLHRYASPGLEAEFASKNVELFMRNWTQRGWCGENFRSDQGVVMGDKHYTWGALMNLVGLESICAIEADGRVTLNGAQTSTLVLKNVPIHGRRYTVEAGPGWARLSDGNSDVLEARGERVSRRL